MARMEHEIVIDRPVEEVYAYAADPGRVPEWQPTVIEMQQTDDRPFGLGSQIQQRRRLLTRDIDLRVTITEWEPNRAFTMTMVSGPARGSLRMSFEERGSATVVRLRGDVRPAGPFGVAAPMLGRAAQAELAANCRRLKARLEGQPLEAQDRA